MKLNNFFKSRNIQAALIATSISLIGILVSRSMVKEANQLSKEANETAKKSYEISNEIYKAKEIPRLVGRPISAKFYSPETPEASGQVKINIAAMIENLSESNARDIAINFETKDWYDHKTSLFNVYKEASRPIPHISSLPKNSQLFYPSYAPDAPSTGEKGFISQDRPFKLKLTVYWKDINNKDYVYVGFYDLRSASLPDNENQLYFQPINTFDSIKDGEVAWEHSKKDL